MNTDIIPANPSDPLAPIDINDVVIPGDTWTSGKILPVPSEPHLVVEEFLAVRKDSESINMETYWFDGGGWQDGNENQIEISAWRRIPMDGIDESVRQGDQP